MVNFDPHSVVARRVLAEQLAIEDIFLSPSEAAFFGLREGDTVEVFGLYPKVQIVRPVPDATMPGEIINRAIHSIRRR